MVLGLQAKRFSPTVDTLLVDRSFRAIAVGKSRLIATNAKS
jgi:16S rRNA G1207 methylase RsmC